MVHGPVRLRMPRAADPSNLKHENQGNKKLENSFFVHLVFHDHYSVLVPASISFDFNGHIYFKLKF
jgi:hypothetical protein